MRVFIDTNVLIDVALEREGFVDDSQAFLDWCSTNKTRAWVAWHTVTNCYYLLRSSPPKGLGDEAARSFLNDLLDWADIAPTSTRIAKAGLGVAGGDLEDHLQAMCAEAVSADVIVTCNDGDFKASPVRAISPSRFMKEFVST